MQSTNVQFRVSDIFLILETDLKPDVAGEIIMEAYLFRNEESLLSIAQAIEEGQEVKTCFDAYQIESVQKDGKPLVYIFDQLARYGVPGAPPEKTFTERYLPPTLFRRIVELWIREKNLFQKDPSTYQKAIDQGKKKFELQDKDKD